MNNTKIGALWVRQSKKDGSEFLSGSFDFGNQKIPVICFSNKNKTEGDNQPTW
jgi:hypothetical protein